MDNTTPTPTVVITVNYLLDKYELKCLPKLAPRTQRNYSLLIRSLLRPHFGQCIASELEPKDFAAFLDVSKGPHNRVRALAVLSSAFTHAVSYWFILKTNVLRDVKRLKGEPRDRLVSQEEFEAFKAQAPERVQLAMMLAVLTGQRQGDIIAFKWSDIRDNALQVRQSKTGKRLAIEITKDLETVLDKCWLLANGGNAGSLYILPKENGNGQPYTSEGFRAVWQRARIKWEKHGGENFHFHDLRALAATRCATPEEAMRLLGHTTLAMTMRVYRRGVERVKALELT